MPPTNISWPYAILGGVVIPTLLIFLRQLWLWVTEERLQPEDEIQWGRPILAKTATGGIQKGEPFTGNDNESPPKVGPAAGDFMPVDVDALSVHELKAIIMRAKGYHHAGQLVGELKAFQRDTERDGLIEWARQSLAKDATTNLALT